jgi:ATP-dependent Lhr-like helicase
LITPEQIRQRRSKRYPAYDPFSAAGRWSLIRAHPSQPEADKYQHCDYVAKVLLRRYGVVFRKLLDQESIVPSWRDLLYVLRRMEARGELRGGRFVAGFAGEQFALPEALECMREIRKKPKAGELLAISAADPLNLTGVITPGQRIATQASQRLVYRDGVPVAVCVQGKIGFLESLSTEEELQVKNAFLRRRSL